MTVGASVATKLLELLGCTEVGIDPFTFLASAFVIRFSCSVQCHTCPFLRCLFVALSLGCTEIADTAAAVQLMPIPCEGDFLLR